MKTHTPSSDKPTENALLTSEEYKLFLRRAQRLRDYPRFLASSGAPLILGAIIVGALSTLWIGPDKPIECIAYLIVCYVGSLFLTWAYARAYIRRQKSQIARLVAALSEAQSADRLGPLLDLHPILHLFERTYPEIRPEMDAAVLRLLPCVTAAQSGSLNSQHRRHLHSYWFRNASGSYKRNLDNAPYLPGLIHAFTQIGDKRDLPEIQSQLRSVYRLAKGPAAEPHTLPAPGHTWIREDHWRLATSLKHCLYVVTERAAREEGKDFLLRPDSRSESGDGLLRPSAESADGSPEQLLRVSSRDSAPPS